MGRFLEEKIIRLEEDANKPSSLYILPIDDNTFRLIITDDNGNKKVNSVLTGSANFTQLNDAPVSYINSAGKVVTVNSTENGLEFTDIEGLSATIEVGQVTSVPSNQPPVITNVGTDKDAIFNFQIPVGIDGEPGESATIQVGNVTTEQPGEPVEVTNVGTTTNAVFEFKIPRGFDGQDGIDGQDGQSSTIEVGSVTTLDSDQQATITNVGTLNDAIFDFAIPRGVDGQDGIDGESATIEIGSVTTVSSTEPASVQNIGTNLNAVFNFEIPKGEQGIQGITYNKAIQSIPITNSDLILPSNKEFNIVNEYDNVNIIFNENSKITPQRDTLNNVNFTVTSTKKHTTEIDPDWFTGSDADKIEAAYEAVNKFLGAAIKINRDYYLDRTVVLEGGSVHILGNAFPNFFPNENPVNSANRKYDCNYNTSRLIANNSTIDKILWIKGANFGGFSACSVWIEGVAFQNNNDSEPIIPRNNCDGIYIDTANAPTRPFTVTKCDFFGLRYGIHIDTREGSFSTGVGAININHNNMHGNIYGVKAQGLSAVLNFSFSNNNAEQNLQGAVDLWDDVSTRVANANINITNNMLEGQPVPIRIKASKSTITIEDNYFESSNLQTIIIRGNVIHTQVFFGKYYLNNDSNLLLDFTNLTYTITSRIFSKQTKIKTLNCLEKSNNNLSYQDNSIISSCDFKDVVVSEPLKYYIPTFDYQYQSVFGTQNGKLMSPTNTQTFNITAVPLVNDKVYLLSFLMKDMTPQNDVSPRRKLRVFNSVNSVAYTDLDSQTFMIPNNANEFMVFCVFKHNLPTGTSGLNIRISGSDSIFDTNTIFSRVGIFEYDGFRRLAPKLDILTVEPTFTTAEQGYTYYNSTSGKLRIWKNTAFIDFV